MVLKTVPIARLVEDFALYPRHDVDTAYVSHLVRAIQAGSVLPPPVVDGKSWRVIDGFHRIRAALRVHGPEGRLEVDARRYKDEASMVKDAVLLNATHGRKLDKQDLTRSALLLQKHGTENKDIAIILHTTEPNVEQILVKVVLVEGAVEPAKPNVWPTGGAPRELSQEQQEVAQSSSGWKSSQTVRQLTRELEVGLLDMEDAGLVEKLWALHSAIESACPKREA